MSKIAMITGVTGQDGSYLAKFLLSKGYQVIGLKRRTSLINTERIDDVFKNKDFILEYFSLFDSGCITRLIAKYKPDEFYNLAAQSHVKVSFETPEETINGIILGTLRILEAIRTIKPDCRFYQASSSEMYGRNTQVPLDENSVMLPASPYACAKLAAHHLTQNYRESYNIHASSGILFNHESPLRGETFVTRKVTRAVVNIKLGLQDKLILGNLDAKRDWGYAKDYVEGMWLMLQQDEPDDYVLSTGHTYSVRDWVVATFKEAGMDIIFRNVGLNEKGYVDERIVVEISPAYFRPQEVPILLGDCTKAKEKIGWEPKTSFKELVRVMYEQEYESCLKNSGELLIGNYYE